MAEEFCDSCGAYKPDIFMDMVNDELICRSCQRERKKDENNNAQGQGGECGTRIMVKASV